MEAKITISKFLRVDQTGDGVTGGGMNRKKKKRIKWSGINFEFQQHELDAIITDLIIQNFNSFNPCVINTTFFPIGRGESSN